MYLRIALNKLANFQTLLLLMVILLTLGASGVIIYFGAQCSEYGGLKMDGEGKIVCVSRTKPITIAAVMRTVAMVIVVSIVGLTVFCCVWFTSLKKIGLNRTSPFAGTRGCHDEDDTASDALVANTGNEDDPGRDKVMGWNEKVNHWDVQMTGESGERNALVVAEVSPQATFVV